MVKKKMESFRAVLVTDNIELRNRVLSLWPAGYANWKLYDTGQSALDDLMLSPPDFLLVDAILPDIPGLRLIELFKSENIYRSIPTLVFFEPDEFEEFFELEYFAADDFVVLPVPDRELQMRIELAILRFIRGFDNNPLTHLPGNTSIIRHLQHYIESKKDFALAYCDVDHFKPFNDYYGFSRGDEVLMVVARLITNTVRDVASENAFVGHVGGDDFIFLLDKDKVEMACQRIISAFDSIIPQFYDLNDRKAGCINCRDRQGVEREFPLMALSIGVVFNINGSISHYGQAAQLAAELKRKAKEDTHSNYLFDKRIPRNET